MLNKELTNVSFDRDNQNMTTGVRQVGPKMLPKLTTPSRGGIGTAIQAIRTTRDHHKRKPIIISPRESAVNNSQIVGASILSPKEVAR